MSSILVECKKFRNYTNKKGLMIGGMCGKLISQLSIHLSKMKIQHSIIECWIFINGIKQTHTMIKCNEKYYDPLREMFILDNLIEFNTLAEGGYEYRITIDTFLLHNM